MGNKKSRRRSFIKTFEYIKKKYLKKLKTGNKTTEETSKTEFGEIEAEKIQIPRWYSKIFPLTPLSEDKSFFNRIGDIRDINQIYQAWRSRKQSAMIITDIRGQGKTTMLNYVNDILFRKRAFKINFDRKFLDEGSICRLISKNIGIGGKTFRSLEKRISSSRKERIVLVDDMHHLYLRKVEGTSAIGKFIRFTISTSNKIFWVMTIDAYAWQLLSKMDVLSEGFITRDDLQPLDHQNINEMIIKKHSEKKINIIFDEPTELPIDIKYQYQKASEKEKQEMLKKKYFKSLTDHTRGNILLICMYWLKSIRKISREKVTVGLKEWERIKSPEGLSDTELLMLEAILQHEWLSLEDISKVFRSDKERCYLIISSLIMKGLMTKRKDGTFTVNPLHLMNIGNLLETRFKKGVNNE